MKQERNHQNRKLISDAVGRIDPRFVDEAAGEVPAERRHGVLPVGKRRGKVLLRWGALAASLLLVVGLVLFLPYDKKPPEMKEYAKSEYYGVIGALSALYYVPPTADNNFEAWFGSILTPEEEVETEAGGDLILPNPVEPEDGSSTGTVGTYEEVTDNQVEGVIEGDRLKRSDRYIFYLGEDGIRVYSIAGEDSTCVTVYPLSREADGNFYHFMQAELYLSSDCRTLTVVASGKQRDSFVTLLLSLDVSNPEAGITERSRICLSGDLRSSRSVDGKLLVLTTFDVQDCNFNRPDTFLPSYERDGEQTFVAGEDILIPDQVFRDRYTVLYLVDGETLEVTSTAAVLSCAETVYVSRDTVYVTQDSSIEEKQDGGYEVYTDATEIAAVAYGDGEFSILDSVTVDGTVKDQYSMDERDGVLRVVTSVSYRRISVKYGTWGEVTESLLASRGNYGAVFCIDRGTMERIGELQGFAPGETVESVRFDGNRAYVCTAVVVTMTDPVFVFDLSDPAKITFKDTGVIEGYSTSLVQLGDGFVLGIGYGESQTTLKVEIYRETEDALVSHAVYELEGCSFPLTYKSYLIDREGGYFGIPIRTLHYDPASRYEPDRFYLLLHFDGETLTEVLTLQRDSWYDHWTRGVLVDDFLYVFDFSGDLPFTVCPITAE